MSKSESFNIWKWNLSIDELIQFESLYDDGIYIVLIRYSQEIYQIAVKNLAECLDKYRKSTIVLSKSGSFLGIIIVLLGTKFFANSKILMITHSSSSTNLRMTNRLDFTDFFY